MATEDVAPIITKPGEYELSVCVTTPGCVFVHLLNYLTVRQSLQGAKSG